MNVFEYITIPLWKNVFYYLSDEFGKSLRGCRFACKLFRDLTTPFWVQRINETEANPINEYFLALQKLNLSVEKFMFVSGTYKRALFLNPRDSADTMRFAIINSYIEFIKWMVNNKNINMKELETHYRSAGKSSLLQLACLSIYENPQIVKFFLSCATFKGSKDLCYHSNDKILLHAFNNACLHGYEIIAKVLINHGIDVEKLDEVPLMFACLNGQMDIIELLLDYNMQVNKTDPFVMKYVEALKNDLHLDKRVKTLDRLIKCGANVNTTNINGETALHLACKPSSQIYQVIECLIKNGAEINANDWEGLTPLHHLYANYQSSLHQIKIIRLLIQHGAIVKNNLKPSKKIEKDLQFWTFWK